MKWQVESCIHAMVILSNGPGTLARGGGGPGDDGGVGRADHSSWRRG